MVQERPTGVSALDRHRQRAAEKKGRCSIEVLPTTKGSEARADKGVEPCDVQCFEESKSFEGC